MCFIRILFAIACASLLASSDAVASHLVTGNGFGFAVVSPETATITGFYTHPYSFVRPEPGNPLSEGVETANFIKSIGWGESALPGASADYEEDSHIVRVRSGNGEGTVYMPFGLRRAALVLSWEPGGGNARPGGLQVEWRHPVRSQKAVRLSSVEMQLLKFDDVPESLLLIPLGTERAHSVSPQQVLASSLAWALVSVEGDDELEQAAQDFIRWRAGLAPQALVKREMAELEEWRVKPSVHFASELERHLWRQSEVMLRIAQSREPNQPGRHNFGLIVASLPDGAWVTPWVRDMSYAAVALARMGHRDEARAALLAYFNAQPTGKMREQTQGADYQISVVRYFGDGSEEPFFTQEGDTNIEFDDWGEALWVLGEYLKLYDDPDLLRTATYRGKLYESARDFVMKPLIANLQKYGDGLIVDADTSIWEEHQKDKKHFAFSTAAAIVGLRDFAEVAQRAGDDATRTQILNQVSLLQKGFNAAFIREGKLRGTLEEGVKNDIDGALLAIIDFGIVTDLAVVRDTVQRMELLKVDSGGYRRVRSTYTDPAIFEYWYERQEFLFVDFSLAEVYWRLGRNAEAAAILERIVRKAAADHNIIPEMYVALPCRLFPGKIGDPTGALPMVGYGAGEYILHLIKREAMQSKH
ncbi:glycoside hydrolase family 15 protein [Acidicapsa acidisoli]|uniref:glycoside hydrolase family 15 protein n=1 Tax=Acidicapsa acidisoli TaxID=1615681 RepID=UPI0021DF770F|nr:glycoside hydrolase family 15 protein [Acidicapsa acidisoli]